MANPLVPALLWLFFLLFFEMKCEKLDGGKVSENSRIGAKRERAIDRERERERERERDDWSRNNGSQTQSNERETHQNQEESRRTAS